MERRPVAGWDFAVGIGVVAISVAVAWQTSEIPVSPAYARVGAKVIPYLVAAGLILLGASLCVSALRGGWSHDMEDEPSEIDWRALGWLGLGLLLNVALIAWLEKPATSMTQDIAAFIPEEPIGSRCSTG